MCMEMNFPAGAGTLTEGIYGIECIIAAIVFLWTIYDIGGSGLGPLPCGSDCQQEP
jgi:hypothetical protein